jgi:hypothetical protein
MQQQQSTDRRATRPTTAADLHRLADQAHANGVQIFQELSTGAWYATSASRAGGLHYLTGLSCTCEGFIYAGRCQHYAMLLERLGWLPDAEATDPEPVAAVPVPVVTVTDERLDDLAERRQRAEQARRRIAARALDPSAADRELAATNASRAARMAAGLSVAGAATL